MDPYALKHALDEVHNEIKRADLHPEAVESKQLIDWAFKILLISELKQLNKTLERMTNNM